jgi:hypothetical protein
MRGWECCSDASPLHDLAAPEQLEELVLHDNQITEVRTALS